MPRLEGIVAALVAAAPAPERVAERVREVLADRAFQTELPKDKPPPELFRLPLGPFELLVRILLWAGLAVLVTLAVVWIARRLSRHARDVEVADPSAAPGAPVAIPIASAEALAAAGCYREAIHALLLETLAALSRAARLAPSLTSREIVGRVPLPPRAREALEGLVDAVEITYFGGEEPAEPDYRACLGRFHLFLETYRGAA
jgi:hypothetical protein